MTLIQRRWCDHVEQLFMTHGDSTEQMVGAGLGRMHSQAGLGPSWVDRCMNRPGLREPPACQFGLCVDSGCVWPHGDSCWVCPDSTEQIDGSVSGCYGPGFSPASSSAVFDRQVADIALFLLIWGEVLMAL